MKIILIAAMTPDRVIGRDGGLPWHEPRDLRHFRRTTMGHAVILGRRTYDEVGRPLPGRRNVVVTRRGGVVAPVPPDGRTTLDCADSLEAALDLCRRRGEEVVFICGGGQLYAAALPLADELLITWIDRRGVAGDTFFPAWRPEDWIEQPVADDTGLRIVRYLRRAAAGPPG